MWTRNGGAWAVSSSSSSSRVPVTIQPGANGVTLAPGVRLGFSSDFVGPLPVGSFWRVRIIGVDQPEAPWLDWHIPTQSQFNGHVIPYVNEPGNNLTVNVNLTIPHNSPARVVVDLNDPSSVLDSGSLDTTWDVTSGIPELLRQTPQVSGSFTAADRAQLQVAADNSTVNFTDRSIPTDLTQVPVGRLPGVAPLAWGTRVGPFDLRGRGTLDLVGQGVLGIWLGIRWFYTDIPTGWGMTPGAIDEFDKRPAQLVPIISLQSGEEIGQPILDTHSSGGFQQLDPFGFTGRVSYDVAPGFTVSLFMYKLIGS